eukprot:m.209825 g.209825  ORF g.209825 m.209825 type:complete len:217 (-) comp24747_c0_seq1:238-888(-)
MSSPASVGGSVDSAPRPKKRHLSRNTSALRFMVRGGASATTADTETTVSPDGQASPAGAAGGHGDAVGAARTRRRFVVTDSISAVDPYADQGRFSAQGFNLDVEKRVNARARAADKEARKRQAAALDEARQHQAEIPDAEMAKRLRTFTRQPSPDADEGEDNATNESLDRSQESSTRGLNDGTSNQRGEEHRDNGSPRKRGKKSKRKQKQQGSPGT